jgi:hypothetical protein
MTDLRKQTKDLENRWINNSLELRDAPALIDGLIVDKDLLIDTLNDLLNDCINFDGGKLTDIELEKASNVLKHFNES